MNYHCCSCRRCYCKGGQMGRDNPRRRRTLSLDMFSSRCLLSAALTMISSKILYSPGTYATWRLTMLSATSS